ncbi:MAG TPA: hypothetical protein VGE90_08455, partial [Chitinophaga sp.]
WFVSRKIDGGEGNRGSGNQLGEVVVKTQRVFGWSKDPTYVNTKKYLRDKIIVPAGAVMSAKVEVKFTFGLEAGLEGEIDGHEVGADLNVASITTFKASFEKQYGPKPQTKWEGMGLFFNKTEKGERFAEVNQGISGGIGLVSAGIGSEFKAKRYGYEDATMEYSGSLGPAGLSVKKGEDGNVMENYVNVARGKLALLGGVEIKVSFGATTEIIKEKTK